MSETLVVALGDSRYEVKRRWGELPADMNWGFVSQVAVNSHGHVYLLQRSDPPVVIFDAEGRFVGQLGAGEVTDGHGIFIDASDRVFVVDRDAHQIRVFTPEHTLAFVLGERAQPVQDAPFNHPTGVGVAGDGEIYVSDGYGNACVHRFSAAGEHLQTWGRLGTGPGEFSTPHSVLITDADQVLVADRENGRVQVFSRTGEFISTWAGLHNPMDLFQDIDGIVHVTDQVPRIHAFDSGGQPRGRCRGAVNGAHGISGDRDGNLYLAELMPERLTKLQRIS